MKGHIGCILYKHKNKIWHLLFVTEESLEKTIAMMTTEKYDFVALTGKNLDFVNNNNFCAGLPNTKEQMKMHSPNLTQENIARIREMFPDCVTETQGEDGQVEN